MIKMVKLVLNNFILAVVTLNVTLNACAVEINGESRDFPAEQAQETRTLHGDFLALDEQRNLQTSVGNFTLPTSTQVVDQRTTLSRDAKVAITYHDNTITHVIIYP